MENVAGLPGAKHKHYQEGEMIKANEEADEVDADVRQKRRELLHKVLEGHSTSRRWVEEAFRRRALGLGFSA